ncbi:MAG TPA: type II secretion system minor pseudopilin GspH [Gammaproteobacteria bacterium]|nr:type II secretion system minor pseudopilin GspH [Gammaproteobacteria bacterium]
MPTSVTGTYRSPAALCKEAGFSLLELLVVVAIIGLLAGAITLSLGALGNDRELQEETNRLRSVIDLLHEESLMQSRDYGVMFTSTGYRFYVYDYQQLMWVLPQTDRLLQQHALRPQLALSLILDGRDVPLERDFEEQDVENAEPQIMLLASGELTPFTIEMQRDGMEGRFELTAALDGEVTVAEKGFN